MKHRLEHMGNFESVSPLLDDQQFAEGFAGCE